MTCGTVTGAGMSFTQHGGQTTPRREPASLCSEVLPCFWLNDRQDNLGGAISPTKADRPRLESPAKAPPLVPPGHFTVTAVRNKRGQSHLLIQLSPSGQSQDKVGSEKSFQFGASSKTKTCKWNYLQWFLNTFLSRSK